jgi:GNAT superfamily N-acetyltransferase
MKYRTIQLDTEDNIRLNQKDLDALDMHCFPSDDLYDKFKGEVNGKPGTHVWWLTYEVETGNCVAFAGIKRYKYTTNVYFCRAGVHRNHRNQGLHHMLLKKRIDWCKANNIFYAYTYTSNDNYASANNLIRHGFLLCEPWFVCDDPDESFYFYMNLKT